MRSCFEGGRDRANLRPMRLLLLVAASLAVAGCKTSIPFCGADYVERDEDLPRPGFFVVPQLRVEAVDIIESKWTPAAVTSELYFGGGPAGATVGYTNLEGTGGFVMGASVLRYISAPRLFEKDGWLGSVVLPDANGRIHFMFGEGDPTLIASFTTDLTGFRVARCLGSAACFHATLRGPTIGPAILMMDPNEVRPSSEPLGALILGGALDAGFVF